MALQIDWKLFLSTLALIFVAELPDKTAFATLLLPTRKQPLAIFIGVGHGIRHSKRRCRQFWKCFGLTTEAMGEHWWCCFVYALRVSDVAEKGPRGGKPPFGKPKI
ncbi:MAG TPA: TMEM165/GDT1 family protein [Candidatus Binatia bacterium]|nr:TMEM165/GDT1 family protein [Candidatus Binatia bacterium]